MSIKKKLGAGVMSAALGISLIGGGTWAAFNDIETVSNTFAAGTLDLSVDPTTVFDIEDLAPGDYMTRDFEIINGGSIEIKDVKMTTTYVVKNKDKQVITGPDAVDFASQFDVDFLSNDGQPVGGGLLGVLHGKNIHELSSMNVDITNAFWGLGLISSTDRILAVGDTDAMRMKISFENRTQKGNDGLYLQNKYQGWTIEPAFKLEAIQRNGMNRPE
ncbi:TasA family protein [Sutcliffiella horikoshii]|uniref:TasA family protein n=1 Tax=Sutcliffiella horikoshii TaxID=79883 RepID=UPI0022AA4E04|nr:TasA family protein [Sutcliffiella horikoshii]MCG1021658.1 cell division protein FtsN [Sutcliffiella horikoshii]